MLAVISPAKKLDETVYDHDLPVTEPAFQDETRDLLCVARDLTEADLKRLMGISDNLAALNRRRFQSFDFPFTGDNAKPAAQAFRGDTYVGLDADSLSRDDLLYAQEHLRILSGLYGLLRPLDLMQPYRLEMGTKLANPRGEDLYDFWGDRLTEALSADLAASGAPVLVNLASNEYFKAVRPAKLKGRVVTPVFKEVKNGVAKIVSFSAKRARGMMARYMIEQRLDRPEGLKDFNTDGYRFQDHLSDDNTLVFTREQGAA